MLHAFHTTWLLVIAVLAVLAGFATLNMTLADSGLAILNGYAAPLLVYLARLTRQV